MPRAWMYKVIMVVVMAALSIGVIIPTVFAPDKEVPEEDWPGWYSWYTGNIYGGQIVQGLDLQGGLHLQYRVDIDTAIRRKVEIFASDIPGQLRDEGVEIDDDAVEVLDGTTLRLTMPAGDHEEALNDVLSLYPLERTAEGGTRIRLEMRAEDIEQTRTWAIETAISTIRSRVDSLGVSEPVIRRQGDSDIVVELPGLGEDQYEDAKELIGTTAQLEFRGIHPRDGDFWRNVVGELPDDEESTLEFYGNSIWGTEMSQLQGFSAHLETLDEAHPGAPPADAKIAFLEQIEYHPRTGEVSQRRYRMMLLNARVEMTGETVSDVGTASDPNTNKPFVSITFDSEGKSLFCDATTRYEGEQLAIVLDDVIKSAPVIEEKICQGRARINMGSSGSFDSIYREVQALVIVLRHGALPAPIEPQFETEVGATLGEESVKKGASAMIVGSVLVLIFMLVYYRGSGVIANVALLLNVLFILAMLTAIGATLTLPGIAGIILTVGMAVDANVIIFERIREELRLGKTARDAVSSGYAKALWTVLDANITTAIAAAVLANYGSGPIRGFAVTLFLGIVSSVFTALFVTRLIFEFLLTKSQSQRLSF